MAGRTTTIAQNGAVGSAEFRVKLDQKAAIWWPFLVMTCITGNKTTPKTNTFSCMDRDQVLETLYPELNLVLGTSYLGLNLA